MAVTAPPKMTLEEFSRLPEGPPYFEFENGELIPMVSPRSNHQRIIGALWYTIDKYARRRKLGEAFLEVDVFLPDGRVYIPDITFLSSTRRAMHSPDDLKIHGNPDLVVEVTSANPHRDRIQKHRVYQDNQVQWYWIIDADTLGIEEYRLMEQGYVRSASVASGEDFLPGLFPGLSINLLSLLSDEPED